MAAHPTDTLSEIRAAGWAVAVHNDYRLHGEPRTFWLFTKGDRAVKGEGRTDAEALEKVRRQLDARPAPQPAPPEDVTAAIAGLLRYVERNACVYGMHDVYKDTVPDGTAFAICRKCGRILSPDPGWWHPGEGRFAPPPELVTARNAHAAARSGAAAPTDVTETAKRIAWAHWMSLNPTDISGNADYLWTCLGYDNRAAYLAAARSVTPPAGDVEALSLVMAEIASERRRQIDVEGWTPEHDDDHTVGELGLAAALYALPYDYELCGEPLITQDDHICLDMALELACGRTIKPEPDRRRRLIKAAALIVAEIERLDRAALRSEGAA